MLQRRCFLYQFRNETPISLKYIKDGDYITEGEKRKDFSTGPDLFGKVKKSSTHAAMNMEKKKIT